MLHVWRANSRRWSTSGVINARRSARASLWASRGVWARLTLPSPSPPPPPRRYVCPSPRQMPTGRGPVHCWALGQGHLTACRAPRFSSAPARSQLWERRMKATLVYTCLHVQNVAALKLQQIPNFFFYGLHVLLATSVRGKLRFKETCLQPQKKKSVYTDAVINSVNVGFGSEEWSFIGN